MRRPIAWLFVAITALLLTFTCFVSATGIIPAVADEQNWRQVLAVRTEKAITEYGERCGSCLHRATVTATLDKKLKDDGHLSRLQNVAIAQRPDDRVEYKEQPFGEASMSKDGRAIYSVSGGVLSTWAAESGERLRRFPVAPYGSSEEDRQLTGQSAVDVVPQGSNARAAVLSETGTVSIWDVERRQLLQRDSTQLPGQGLESSEGGTWVGWWGQNEAIAWNSQRRGVVRMAHPGVLALLFLGESEAITLSDGHLQRWDLARGTVQARVLYQAEGKYLGHSHNGRWLYFSVQGQLIVQDSSTGAVDKRLDTRAAPMRMACSADNERYLAAGSEYGSFLLWDHANGQLLAEQSAHSVNLDLLRCAAASPRVLSVGTNRRVGQVWDLERVAGRAKREQLGVPVEIVFSDRQWWLQDLVNRALAGKWLERAPWLLDLFLGREALLTALSIGGLFLLYYFAKGLSQYSKT